MRIWSNLERARDGSGGAWRCLGLLLVIGCGSQPSGGPDGPASPDAAPAIDARIDATVDATVDAPPVPPPFHVTPPATPFHRSALQPAEAIEFRVTNDTGGPLAVAVSATGPFGVDASQCASVAPGEACIAFVHLTSTALGVYAGSLALTAAGTTVTVPLEVTLEAFVLGSANAGGGRVTIDPPEDGCLGCYPPGTAVTLTAVPAAGFHFTGWVDGGIVPHVCATNPCTVTASATPTWNEARFERDPHTFTFNFTGDGPGTVFVRTSMGDVFCSGSCTVAIDTPTIEIGATTLVDFGGFSAPCGRVARCTLPDTATSIDVAFSKRPGEQDLDVGGGTSVDFDPANELVIGGASIRVFTAALAPKWTAPVAGVARFAANGDVLVRTSSAILKLAAADGQILWQHPTPAAPPPAFWGPAHLLAATPAGGAVVGHGPSVEVLAPDGASHFALPIGGPQTGAVATGADGRIYVGVQSVDDPANHAFVEVFSPLGVREQPDFAASFGSGLSDAQTPAAIGVGTANLVVTVHGLDDAGFVQFAADRSLGGEVDYDYTPGSQLDLPAHLVATNASDQIAFAVHPDFLYTADASGLLLIKYDAARHELYRVERLPLATGGDHSLDNDGFDLADVAIAPDGRIAVLDRRSLVEVFAP
jgi:hypothetical protein